jgi:hypothetical protein
MTAPQLRGPAPRANAGNRAEVIRNKTSHTIARAEPEADFAAIYRPAVRSRLAACACNRRAGELGEGARMKDALDFTAINQAALAAFPAVLNRLLPRGKAVGREIVALNPRRADRNLGSFKVNRFNGRWCDFATGDKGGDPISLVAYLADVSQGEAARLLAQMLGLETGGRRHG